MDRRKLFSVAGAAALATTLRPVAAATKEAMPFELRGLDGQLRRLPSLDVASNQDFLSEVRTWVQRSPEGLMRIARARAAEVLQENGFNANTELPVQQVIEMMERDTAVMASARAWLAVQDLTWAGIKQLLYANPEVYLAELRAAENQGPGVLELNPTMHIPDYCKHEIHIMPGGYVGDPLAGYIFHYGTNGFNMGHNNQDEVQVGVASGAQPPAAGKVRRILEIGCSIGQTTVALKRRFPDAEVWGVDIGGPMVDYAHMRAADLGVDVNFRQCLAEATGFPDGYFDMVVSFILHHEVPNAKNTEVIREVARVLRSGGTYYPVDAYTRGNAPPKNAYGLFVRWWDHRWNNEVWFMEHLDYDLEGDMERAGLAVSRDGAPALLMRGGSYRPRPNIYGTKQA